jgi:DNA (cytosine-5)-methyltransferase 1
MSAIRFVDLFAGLGGFHVAAAQLGMQCVFACEIDPDLRSVYERNFGIEPVGDIKNVQPEDVPPHDLLCAGFPCQPFSKAGGQLGWKDAVRGTVFYEVVRILEYHRPELVVLENVAHFVRHDSGNTYKRVKEALESLGYDIKSEQLSPHNFGVPQIRERMYMVGRLREAGGLIGFEWPRPVSAGSDLSIRTVLDKNPANARPLSLQVTECLNAWQEFIASFPRDEKLPSFPVWSMEFGATYPYNVETLYTVRLEKLRQFRGRFGCHLDYKYRSQILELVPSHARHREKCFPRWKQLFIRQNRELYLAHKSWIDKWLPRIKAFPPSLQKLEWNCQGEQRDIWQFIIQFRASGVRVKRPTTSPSLVAMTTTQVPIIGWERRYMTVEECARLQSMEGLKHLPTLNLAMLALGNAINVKVARLVIEKLLLTRVRRLIRSGQSLSRELRSEPVRAP